MSYGPFRLVVVVALFAQVAIGWSTTAYGIYRVHYSLVEDSPRPVPTRVLLLPIDVKVSEMSAGGVVEEVGEWTEQAQVNIKEALLSYAKAKGNLEILSMSRTSYKNEVIDEHLALYNVVAGSAHRMTTFGGAAWKHKVDRFDYTLGSGLAFLKERTGADAGLLVIGRQQVSTGGRKAAAIFAALLVGAVVSTGGTYLTTGIVDFETGDILWFNYETKATKRDLRKAENANAMIELMLKKFPGLEAYRK